MSKSPRGSVKQDVGKRVYIAFALLVLIATAILVRMIDLQYVQGADLREKGERQSVRTVKLPFSRGNILTEDGELLATSKTTFDIAVDFRLLNDTSDKAYRYPDTFLKYVGLLADSMSRLYPVKSSAAYRRSLMAHFKAKKRYQILKKGVHYSEYMRMKAFPLFEKGRNRSGFIAEPKSVRVNPYGDLAYRTIGLWRDNSQSVGLEASFDEFLTGKQGKVKVRRVSGGRYIPIKGTAVEAELGADLVTTIDLGIQDITERALLETLKKYGVQYGTAVVMEVKTGKVRAIANLGRTKSGAYKEDYNYAIALSEPGSTFKLFSLFSLLEDGFVNINTKVNCMGGRRKFGKNVIRDDHSGMGSISIKDAFAFSSNVAFSGLVYDYYKNDPQRFIDNLKRMGLGQKTGIDIKGEHHPLLRSPKSKSWISNISMLPWIGYGYSSTMSPLQTCMLYNAVANEGRLMKPYLVSEIRENGAVVKKFEPTVLNPQIGSPETIRQLKEVLLEVVENKRGTARSIKSPYFKIGGKTGTAQVAGKGFSYKDGVKQGSFAGFFPWDNPKYTIVVLVRSVPGGAYYGSVVAAPVFKAIADKIYGSRVGGYDVIEGKDSEVPVWNAKRAIAQTAQQAFKPLGYSMASSDNWVVGATEGSFNQPVFQGDKVERKKVPNVQGLGLKDAVLLLERLGMQVQAQGVGAVLKQSIAPGSLYKKGQKIMIELG